MRMGGVGRAQVVANSSCMRILPAEEQEGEVEGKRKSSAPFVARCRTMLLETSTAETAARRWRGEDCLVELRGRPRLRLGVSTMT
jgi:hypothetical protein